MRVAPHTFADALPPPQPHNHTHTHTRTHAHALTLSPRPPLARGLSSAYLPATLQTWWPAVGDGVCATSYMRCVGALGVAAVATLGLEAAITSTLAAVSAVLVAAGYLLWHLHTFHHSIDLLRVVPAAHQGREEGSERSSRVLLASDSVSFDAESIAPK